MEDDLFNSLWSDNDAATESVGGGGVTVTDDDEDYDFAHPMDSAGTGGDDDDEESDAADSGKKPNIITRIKDRLGVKKFVTLIVIITGTIILSLAILIFMPSNKPVDKQSNDNNQQAQAQTQHEQTQTPVQNNTDWLKIDEPAITNIKTHDCVLKVNKLNMFACKTNGTDAALEMRVEVSGTLIIGGAAHAGICNIEVPYKYVAAIQEYLNNGKDLQLNATCKTGKVGDTTIVFDAKLSE